ncbi:hypothetical protein [Krasilnikovia sp. MM14-A1259]|uniref:hypothetical protein n=1 Tax=Krasilnikovia sp. MM14-A1259 TaxID=3373539 RepID=UPI00399CFEBA
MDDELAAAVARVREAFVHYPRRAVLEGCPHCRPQVPVDEGNLFSLTIRLGNTVGDRDDVKALLPVLLERLVTSGGLDPAIVLAKLPQEQWRTWPEAEQDAVHGYLDSVWRSLLAEYPSRVRCFADAATFLDAAAATGESVSRFLDAWDATSGSSADRHLADLVTRCAFAGRRAPAEKAWLHREAVRARLYCAFEREHDTPWADDLARACDLIGA